MCWVRVVLLMVVGNEADRSKLERLLESAIVSHLCETG